MPKTTPPTEDVRRRELSGDASGLLDLAPLLVGVDDVRQFVEFLQEVLDLDGLVWVPLGDRRGDTPGGEKSWLASRR